MFSGAKVHRGICRFLKETGKASHSWYGIAISTFSPRHSVHANFPRQVGLTPSRLAQLRNSHRNRSTGFISVPLLSPVMSIYGKLWVSVVYERFTAPAATVARAHLTTSTPVEA